jgi:hypothetical protein
MATRAGQSLHPVLETQMAEHLQAKPYADRWAPVRPERVQAAPPQNRYDRLAAPPLPLEITRRGA